MLCPSAMISSEVSWELGKLYFFPFGLPCRGCVILAHPVLEHTWSWRRSVQVMEHVPGGMTLLTGCLVLSLGSLMVGGKQRAFSIFGYHVSMINPCSSYMLQQPSTIKNTPFLGVSTSHSPRYRAQLSQEPQDLSVSFLETPPPISFKYCTV